MRSENAPLACATSSCSAAATMAQVPAGTVMAGIDDFTGRRGSVVWQSTSRDVVQRAQRGCGTAFCKRSQDGTSDTIAFFEGSF